jgi:type VI secretion system FHA domain protein
MVRENKIEGKLPEDRIVEHAVDVPKIESKHLSTQGAVDPIQQKSSINLAFFEALGVDVKKLPEDEEVLEQLMFNAGKMLKSTLESQMTLLKARADIKREFSSSMTMLQKEENNPLKFCQSVDEALAHFFINPSSGFLSGQLAVEESSSDLCTHQMAMMSGIQSALQSTISVFDPVVLENSSNIGGFNKNSKYWEYYVSHYKKLSREAKAEFFGDDFSKAYEQQVRAMNNSR